MVGALPGALSAVAGRVAGEQAHVLVVDDDPQILRYVRNTLSEAGYVPIVTGDPEKVEILINVEQPDLILLDLLLPGIDGFELMQRIPRMSDVPVVFLSARGRDQDIARAFEMGADDYIVKPFSPTELVARIRAALRRRAVSAAALESFVLGELAIDNARRLVTLEGNPLRLTETEYRLLAELSANAGRVLTNEQLLPRV